MSAQTFCPNCGSPRAPGARFCASCGQPFEGVSPGPVIAPAAPSGAPPPAIAISPSNTSAVLAGVSWLIAAALSGYLAYQQWSLSQQLAALGLGDDGLGGYAAWNAIAGAITLFFAARLLTSPTRGLLGSSMAWAILSVLGGVLQIASGIGNDVFVFATIAAAAAGVLSYTARQAMPTVQGRICVHCGKVVAADRQRLCNHCGKDFQDKNDTAIRPMVSEPVAAAVLTSPGANAPLASTATPGTGSRTAERVVIALIVLAVLGGGTLLLLRMQVDQTMADVASLIAPTNAPRATPFNAPQPDEMTAKLGEVVELIDGAGDDLGSITVIKNGKPSALLEIPPASGNRYIAALVNYSARASWSYNLFDWAVHDTRQIQYEPLGLAPNPMLSYGTLSAGRQVEAWVAFEIPATVRDVWLDYRSGGIVIFSVKID